MAKKYVKEDQDSGLKQYKVRTDLGFTNGKRNYFIDNVNYLLVEGEYVDETVYNLFDEYCKKVFFE